MGTTPDSSSVIPALTSICQQLAYNYSLPMDQMPDDLIPLMFYYKQLLLNASYDQPLVIFLDSVDQLDGPMVSLKLSWLSYELPENCKIVVSCVSEGDCEDYHFLRKALGKFENTNFLAIPTLTKTLAIDVIKTMLRDVDRTLTDIQWTVVQKTLQCCTLPIFLKLVYARVIAWKSYTIATTLSLNVMDSIMSLFDRVEVQHGKCLVSYALAYITASKCGLSESELEDLISLDDIVLNDIYQYHLPPIRRIPPLLWTRIRSDLPNYLTERDADGVSVMNWYHRQFREASIIRYLSDGEQVEYFHSMIADYFIGMWGGIEKPFQFTEIQKSRFGLKTDIGSADRKVPQQPNVYHAADGTVSRFNGRKFGELSFHLSRSKRFEDLFHMVLFNYEWLHSKLSCCPLQSVLADFEYCKVQLKKYDKVEAQDVKEVQLMIDAIKLAAAILIQYPSMLAPQILARLIPLRDEFPNISSLLRQCDAEGVKHCALLPINHCQHTPGGPLMYSLEGHSFAVFDFILTSDNRYVLSVSNKFLMWDLSTGEVSREVDPHARGIMQVLVITGDDKLALTFTNYNDVWALDILTGEILFLDGDKLQFPSPILGIQVASDNKIAVVWCQEKWATLFLHPKLRVNHIFSASEELEEHAHICTMRYESCDLFHVTYFTEKGSIYWLQTFVKGHKLALYKFHSGIVITDTRVYSGTVDKNITFSSLDIENEAWSEPKDLPAIATDESDVLLSLIESHREDFIVGMYLRGFKVYSVTDKHFQPKYLTLPHGVRNISVQPLQVVSRLLFTKYNQYAVAGIRRSLYVWSVSDGRLMKIIDAHYGRIVEMLPLVVDDINAVATSSLDRTVKVWNIRNIFEQVHVIDRMELPVDSITFAAEMGVAAVVTRSCVGLWDMSTGRLKKTLAHSTIGAIVTHAVVSQSGNFLISVESGHLLVWDLRTEKLVIRERFEQVKDLKIVPKSEQIVITTEQEMGEKYGTYCVKILDILSLDQKYTFQYFNRKKEKLRTPCVTVSGRIMVLPDIEIPENVRERDTDTLTIYETSNGRLLKTVQLGSFTELIATMFKGNDSVIGVLSPGSGQILDVSTNRVLAKVPRWNSACTRDGSLGLCASARSGLEVIELRHGSAVRVLLPKVTEGLVNFITGFTADDEYVYYYHGTKRTIRLFRVSDGEMIANYRLSAEAKVVTSSPDGQCLLVGGIDGSLVVLIIADPSKAECHKRIAALPSRCVQQEVKVHKTPLARWTGAVRMTKFASKNQTDARRSSTDSDSVESKACSIS
jgi:WD40 repeat protein